MTFEIVDIKTTPKDTGVSQYIKMEVEIVQYSTDTQYANGQNPEIYAGEGVGLL